MTSNGVENQNVETRLAALEEKIDKIYASSEKTRKYFLWTFIITVGAIALPIVGLMFAIPKFLATYDSLLNF